MTAISTPLVSVIVATYHRDKELSTALQSIGTQTYQPIEVIVVDDNNNYAYSASVDENVQQFAQSYPNISLKYIRHHHRESRCTHHLTH